jgi:hypothetical protein
MTMANKIRRRRNVVSAALAVVPLLASRDASAGTKYYVGPATGYWSSTTSWSNTSGGVAGAPVPVTGDLVYVTNAAGTVQTLNYNISGAGISLGSLTLDATGGSGTGDDILLNSGNTLTVAGPFTVGNNGTGTLNQSAGATSANLLYLGYNGGSGSVILSGGTLSATTADSSGTSEYVGYNAGTGLFTQTGGTHNVSGNFIIGYTNSSFGSYSLSTSTSKLTVTGNEYVSYAASGTTLGGGIGGSFYQTAGTHGVNGTLVVGEASTASGYFDLAGGTLAGGANATAFTSGETIGDVGYGDFFQSGGTNTVGTPSAGQLLTVANYGTAEYDMYSSGIALAVNGNEIIGRYNGSSGTFYQLNGAHTVSGFLSIGDFSGATGILYLSAGTLNVGTGATVPSGNEYSNYEIIGAEGTGTIIQSGGTNTVGSSTVPQHLEIGYGIYGTTGVGTYNLYSGATLTVYGSEYVGDGASGTTNQSGGTFNQSGGTHTISAGLYVANGSGATGTFNLYGGTLSANQEYVATGGGAYGVFLQTGGTNSITTSGTQPGLFIGTNSADFRRERFSGRS